MEYDVIEIEKDFNNNPKYLNLGTLNYEQARELIKSKPSTPDVQYFIVVAWDDED